MAKISQKVNVSTKTLISWNKEIQINCAKWNKLHPPSFEGRTEYDELLLSKHV